MDKKKDITTLLQEAVDSMVKHGGTPYAVFCSRKTFDELSLYFLKLSPVEKKFVFRKMRFVYSFGDLPILKFKYCPEDKIHVVDKETYKKIMKMKKLRKTKSIFDKHPCELLKGKER